MLQAFEENTWVWKSEYIQFFQPNDLFAPETILHYDLFHGFKKQIAFYLPRDLLNASDLREHETLDQD